MHAGKDDYFQQMNTEKLYSRKPILWNHYGIEINSHVDIPDDQKVEVGVNLYHASKPEFSFPEEVFTKSYVYQIRVSPTDESLINGIHVTLTNFPQPQDRQQMCILEASGNPSRWGANLTPEFKFSPVEASRFQLHDRAGSVAIRSTTCYLAIAGE